MNAPFKVRIQSNWAKHHVSPDGSVASTDINATESNGTLWYWNRPDENLDLSAPVVWYNCEPEWLFDGLEGGAFVRTRDELPPGKFINHRLHEPELRTPHVTHWGVPEIIEHSDKRRKYAVAVVSNSGFGAGGYWVEFRNRMVAAKGVELFGRRSSWSSFRRTLLGRRRPPKSYRGEIPSDRGEWHSSAKRKLQSTFHACVCLENSFEEHYFTEKFVEAVIAGCVPIYHAHPSVRDTFLAGAKWIDPADFDLDPTSTIAAALNEPRRPIAAANQTWLRENPFLAASRGEAVMYRLVTILRRQA